MLEPLQNVGWDSTRTCLRGTRSAVINDLVRWASNSEESGTGKNNRIYVLQGPKGCGKSSIAHSVAQAFHLQKRLGAAIFLDNRTEEKTIGSQILSTTIASQLAAYDQNIREAIAAKIKADASLANADAVRQFCGLIVSATEGLALIGPICIVIDGLQQIANPAEKLKLLSAIADYFPNLPSNFRLLLTSEHGQTSKDITQLMPDCIIKEITFNDEGTVVDYSEHILQSLRHLFSKKLELAERYTIEDLRDRLIERSMGLYFWISTALQFLLSCAEGDECTILTNILSTELPRTKEVAMDQLFRIILTCIPAVHLICRILIQSSKPMPLQDSSPKVSITDASHPTYQSPILNMMQTFLIEHGTDKTNNPLFTIHPSVEDFLTSSRRCHGTTLYVDRFDPTRSVTMFDICFDSMEAGLRRNICRLDDIMALNEEIPDKNKRLGQYIPVMLQHACRHWIFHLEALDLYGKLDSITPVIQRLDTFLSNHLLHWIECMSLFGWVDVISTSLDRLSSWLIVSVVF
jgi:AAA ATPase domain